MIRGVGGGASAGTLAAWGRRPHFDDRGMNGHQTDGTDWGDDDGWKKCGTQQTAPRLTNDEAWFLFVR